MPEQNNDVKTDSASSAQSQSDVKALNAIVDSVMASQGDGKASSPEPKAPAPEDAESAESLALKKSETGEMTEEEVSEEKDEPAEKPEGETTEEGDGAGETEETETDKKEDSEKKHEDAVPYARFKEVNEKVATLEPLAQAQRELGQYCQTNKIGNDQLIEALNVAAMVNNNPEQALAKFESYVEQLRVALGKGLPADLQKEVTEGLLSEARAKELAQSRIKTQNFESSNRFAQLSQQQAMQQQVTQAMGSWMDSKQKLNPSFVPKAKTTDNDGPFEDFLRHNTWLFTQQRPANGQSFTPFEMTAMAEQAYNETLKMAARYTPAKPAKKVLSSTNSSHRSTDPADAKSEKDVVEQIARKYKLS